VEQLFKYVNFKFGLSKKALRGQRVEIALTIDRARLDDGTFHITSVFKLVYTNCIDPNNEKRVYINMQSVYI
jgi:hypothetical protein